MATNDTRRLRVVVTGDSSGGQQAVEAVAKSAEKTESKLGKLAKFMGEWGLKGSIALGAIGAAAGAMGLKTAMGLEQAEVGFTTMLGSAQKARKFIGELQKFAAATPFEFPELVGSAQQFLAMGFAAKDVIPMLTAVGDAVAAMGGSAENIDSVTRALTQMQSKGKVSGEEMMQLAEQGIPVLQILADSYGVSTSKMSKMIEKGQVLSSKAIPAIIKGLESGTKNVKGFGGMMAKQSETMAGKWSTLMDNLQTGLAGFVSNFEPQIKSAMDFAGKVIGDFFAGISGKGKLEGFTGTINEIGLGLRAMVEAFKGGGVTSDGLVGKFEKVGVAAKQVVDTLKDLANTVADVIGWFKEHDDVAKALAITIAALVVVTKAHTLAMFLANGGLIKYITNLTIVQTATKVWAALQWVLNGAIAAGQFVAAAAGIGLMAVKTAIITVATKAWAAAQWLLTAAMNLSPIGIMIIAIVAFVAIIVLAYNKVGWFRAFIQFVWKVIKTDTELLVRVFQDYMWPVISKVLSAIGTALQFLYNVIWKPIWILIQIAIGAVVFYIQNVAWPVWKFIFQAIGAAAMWLWNNAIKPAFTFINTIMTAVATYILTYVWPRIKAAFDFMKNAVVALWNLWKSNFDKVRDKAGEIMNAVVGAFNKGKDGIKKAWDQVADVAKKPVNFVIGTVYNNGIRKLWNTVAEKFGVKTRLDEIKTLAGGGVMPGYAPGKDTIPAMLSPGEGVLVPELVRMIGANNIIAANKAARAGQAVAQFKDGGIVGFGKNLINKGKDIFQGAAGAVVKPLVDQLRGVLNDIPMQDGLGGVMKGGVNKLLDGFLSWVTGKDKAISTIGGSGSGGGMGWQNQINVLRSVFPGLPLISGFRPGARTLTGNRSYHAIGRAVDVPPRKDVAQFINNAYGKVTKELITPWNDLNLHNGQRHTYTGAVWNQHNFAGGNAHDHWAVDNGGVIPPGSTVGLTNATTRQEYALTEDKIQRLGGVHIDNVTIVVKSSDPKQAAKEIRDELIKLGNRNGGTIGLPTK